MLYGINKIGVLGGHGDGVNAIPGEFATTPELAAYREGTAMHRLATTLGELPGVQNLRPEADNISWKERALRLSEAGSDLGVDLHTNWSLDENGEPNTGIMVVIVALYNPVHGVDEQKTMATQLFEPLARSMGLSFSVRTKKGSGEWDWYSFINECNQKSIPYPMIVEHGYHQDFASDVDGNIALVKKRYQQIVAGTSGSTYYRVHAGEYASEEEASEVLNELIAKGYTGRVVRYPSVQMGAFRNRVYADNLLQKLYADGYTHAYMTSIVKNQ